MRYGNTGPHRFPMALTISHTDKLVAVTRDARVNLFGIADTYIAGESEALLGAALKSRRNELLVAIAPGFCTAGAKSVQLPEIQAKIPTQLR